LGGILKAARLGEGQAAAREGFGDGFSLAKHIHCAAICGENQYCSGIKLDNGLKVL
jgi:hypothetical protein